MCLILILRRAMGAFHGANSETSGAGDSAQSNWWWALSKEQAHALTSY